MHDVFVSNNPPTVVPTVDTLEYYATMPELVTPDITTDTIGKMSRKMS